MRRWGQTNHSQSQSLAAAGEGIRLPGVFRIDHHDPDDLEFRFSPSTASRAREPNVIDELAEFVTQDNVVAKNRYSGFFNTNLAERLADLNPDKVIICGVCTDICVLHTTSDARNRDYPVEVPADLRRQL